MTNKKQETPISTPLLKRQLTWFPFCYCNIYMDLGLRNQDTLISAPQLPQQVHVYVSVIPKFPHHATPSSEVAALPINRGGRQFSGAPPWVRELRHERSDGAVGAPLRSGVLPRPQRHSEVRLTLLHSAVRGAIGRPRGPPERCSTKCLKEIPDGGVLQQISGSRNGARRGVRDLPGGVRGRGAPSAAPQMLPWLPRPLHR